MINVEIKEMKQILDDKLKGIITTALQDNDHPINELLPKQDVKKEHEQVNE